MNLLPAIAIAIMQGATELFPVSSLGHAVLIPALLGFALDLKAASFLPFLVMLHLGTVFPLLGYFWRDWWALATGIVGRDGDHRQRESFHILVLIVIATVPVIIIGGGLEHAGLGRKIFGTPLIAASGLIANGIMLFIGQSLRNRAASHDEQRAIATLTYRDAAVIGLWQCLALIPGISRSGSSIVGGMRQGLNPAGAAHFSFLIAIPAILGATVLEIPKMLHQSNPPGTFGTAAMAAVVAGFTALAAVTIMMRLFRNHENWALTPYAVYCLLLGITGLGILVL
jgi:undecaprenyl-diphosphatase